MDERRRNVRAKPRADLPSHVVRQIAVGISDQIEIVDISVSGLALSLHGGDAEKLDDPMMCKLVLGAATYDIKGQIRWRAKGMVGLELVEVSEETSKAIRRYVGELLERG